MQTTAIDQNIFSGMQYRDAYAAIDWLEQAFGFRRRLIIPGPDGTIAHAEVQAGENGGLFMLGSGRPDSLGYLAPLVAGGVTSALYVVVDDVDAHCERARAAGAQILVEPHDQPYGARDYTARDPEGYVWNFGTYRPGR
jgi:uncharacterized glyoxalase superfamily protein PhnB